MELDLQQLIDKVNLLQIGDTYNKIRKVLGNPDYMLYTMENSSNMLKFKLGFDTFILTIYTLKGTIIVIDDAQLRNMERRYLK